MKNIFLILFCFLSSFCFARETGARYLIITHDNYFNAIKPLAEWKTQKGCKTKIVKLSEIGSDSTQIRNYIVNAYNTWEIKPEYLLLVGNKNQLPFPRMGYAGYDYYYSDNYYTNVAGDFRNEIIPGRLWVFDTIQAMTIVAKILGYEKNPYLADPLWFKKGTTIVNTDDYPPYSDSVYWADTKFLQKLMINGGFVKIDSFSDIYGDSSIDVVNAINNGRSFIMYRGVGVQTWDYPFMYINPNDMYNRFKLPVVISATCATVDGIGYWWLNAGTPEEPKGTIGFFGTTTILEHAAELRSALAKGTIQAIFRDSLVTLGKAAEAGRLYYYNLFGNTLEYNGWTCLGDPEMNLWTTTPRSIQVLHTSAWVNDTYTVQVLYNFQPVESVLVCIKAFYDSTKYFYKRTDGNGKATFIGNLYHPDSAILTVTGRNLLPFFDTIIGGYTNGPFMIYHRHLILDTIAGNGNYQPNNGENIELAIWIRNIGNSTAYNVTGILQKAEPDNYYQISDTIKSFGNILSSDSAFTTDDGFNISIHPDCPDSHMIRLKLEMTDANNTTWISYFNFLVYSPRPYLIYKSCLINDSLGGNGNNQINPGETIELGVWLQNIGDSMAENVIAALQKQTPDSFFTLDDTIKYFGTILPQDSAGTGADGYNIYIDSFCPDQHLIQLQIKITDSLDSLWIYNFSLKNYAPDLVFENYYIDESKKYINPGDTASLLVLIENIGSATAQDIVGHLISSDTFITVISDSCYYGDILPDSSAGNQLTPLLIFAHPDAPPCYPTNLKLRLDGVFYHDTINFSIYIGQLDYLVWDPDPNHSSGFIIHQKLLSLGYSGNYSQTFPSDYLNIYKSLFVTCGMSPNKFVININSPVVPEILDFLNDGGRMYLEGGDVWYYDPLYQNGYNFCPLFCITPVTNSIGYFTGIAGIDSTFAQSMSFNYSGETNSMDRINPVGNGVSIFKNPYNNNSCGVAANHRTVGLSFEFGGLVDGLPPSTKLILADSIMRYFEILPSTGIAEQNDVLFMPNNQILEIYPNPFRNRLEIRYEIPDVRFEMENEPISPISYPISAGLKIYDVTGRVVKTFNLATCYSLLATSVVWDGTDDSGRRLASGIYFVRLEADGYKKVEKAILLR